MDRATGDYMGMLATVMNGLALQDALEKAGVPTRVMSRHRHERGRRAVHPPPRACATWRRAAWSSSPPAPATRTSRPTPRPPCAPSRSAPRCCSRRTKVDGVYTADPLTDPDAVRHDDLTYAQVLTERLQVLDSTAVSLCMENDLPIIVFDMNQPDNIRRAALGEPVGTLIHGGDARMTDADRPTLEARMARAVEAMERDFAAIRTGRASTVARGAHPRSSTTARMTPLNQLASISVPEAHQIVIQPWDRGVLGAIEKAIQKSDVGLMPNVDGTVVRLNIPPLTEERRKDLVKVVHKRMEEARVEIRNHRRDGARRDQASARRTARSAPTRRAASRSASRS